jgi:hypothetical protein
VVLVLFSNARCVYLVPSFNIGIDIRQIRIGFSLTRLIFYIEAAVAVWPIAVVGGRAWCCLTTPHIQINLLEEMTTTTMIISLDESKGDAGSGLLPVELWRRGGGKRIEREGGG